jgi:hypothetical protein
MSSHWLLGELGCTPLLAGERPAAGTQHGYVNKDYCLIVFLVLVKIAGNNMHIKTASGHAGTMQTYLHFDHFFNSYLDERYLY